MPAKKMTKKSKEASGDNAFRIIGRAIAGIAKAIWAVLVQIGLVLKAILVVLEKALKIIAIFIIAISASVLFLVTSLYLFSATFGLKKAPAFQELRNKIAEDFSASLKDDMGNVEIEIENRGE